MLLFCSALRFLVAVVTGRRYSIKVYGRMASRGVGDGGCGSYCVVRGGEVSGLDRLIRGASTRTFCMFSSFMKQEHSNKVAAITILLGYGGWESQ